MGPSLKSLAIQPLGTTLALLIVFLASFGRGPAPGLVPVASPLPDPAQAHLLPVGGSALLFELPLLVPPAPQPPGSGGAGSEIKGPAQHVVSISLLPGRVNFLRFAPGRPKRGGLRCGLPLGAHAPPWTA